MNRHQARTHGRRRTRQEGSALIIATIVIVITVAMIGVLLAVPEAQLAQVASSVAKQRALENADAGAREAMLVMQTSSSNLQTWLPVGGTNVLISGQRGTGQPAPGTAPTPAPPAFSTSPSFFPCDLTTTALPMNAATSFPAFVASNWRQFGDRVQARGQFAYAVVATAQAGYFKILVEGQAQAAAAAQNTSGAFSGALTVSALIEVVVLVSNPINSGSFSAVSFLNASGGAGNPPTQPFGTAGTQTQIMLLASKQKTYTNGFANNTGVFYPAQPSGTPTPALTLDASDPAGSTPAAGNPASNTLSSATASIQKQFLAIADAANAKAGGVSQTFTSGGYSLYYNHFAAGSTIDNTTWTNPLDVHSMNNGIVIFDLEDNVTINLQTPSGNGNNIKGSFFRGNGNGSFGGTVIFVQRGRLNVTGNKFYLIDWNPANSSDNLLSYDQAAIDGALSLLTLPPGGTKIASFRVVQ